MNFTSIHLHCFCCTSHHKNCKHHQYYNNNIFYLQVKSANLSMASPITIGIVFIHPGSIGLKLDYSDLFISDFHLADLLIGRAGKQKINLETCKNII